MTGIASNIPPRVIPCRKSCKEGEVCNRHFDEVKVSYFLDGLSSLNDPCDAPVVALNTAKEHKTSNEVLVEEQNEGGRDNQEKSVCEISNARRKTKRGDLALDRGTSFCNLHSLIVPATVIKA